MATGGRSDQSTEDGLDLTEITSELAALYENNEFNDTADSVVWEETKAQEGWKIIEAESDFIRPVSSTPTPLSEVDFALTQSAPTSPISSRAQSFQHSNPQLAQPNLTVQQQIKSFESLAQLQSTGAIPRRNTRSALKQGLGSPLAAAGNFERKFRPKPKVEPFSLPTPIITMAQPDIPAAGRLNPRTRNAGGVGDTLASLGYGEINQLNIPPAGKNVLRRFLPRRKAIAEDANLVLTADNVSVGKTLLEGYIAEIVALEDKFDKVLEGIEDENPNAEAAINEIVKVEGELKGLLKYCTIQLARNPAQAAGADDDLVKLEKLSFPEFDGSGNYNTWKANFNALAVHVRNELTKKGHLLRCLKGNAKTYIESTMVSTSTFTNIFGMLEGRYNDPMAVNYNLLHRVFNSPDLAKTQSTQAHWDSAVGDIKAVVESGLTVGEILVYFRLHRFPNDTVRRVKDLHKIIYQGRPSISLDEAIQLMNRLTTEEISLTEDSVAIDQCLQSLSLSATLKTVQPSKPSPLQAPPTHVLNAVRNTKKPNRGRGGKTGHQYRPTPPQPYCHMCDNNDHFSNQCPHFTTLAQKCAELARIGKCQSCGNKTFPEHRCPFNLICKNCRGQHRHWLCNNQKTGTTQNAA